MDETVGSATPIPPEVPSVAASRADFFASSSSMRRTSASVSANWDVMLLAILATAYRS